MSRQKIKLAIIKVICLLALFSLASCHNQGAGKKGSKNQSVAWDNVNYTGSFYKGNYVWGGAMNLAWNELSDNIVHEKISLATEDQMALETLKKLNNPVIISQDLDEKSYYIKSGFGQKTVDTINRESKKKFPDKTFADLDIQLDEKDIIAYAYFLKEVQYLLPFQYSEVNFEGNPVAGFKAVGESRDNIRILDYKDGDHFLVAIKLNKGKDQIFLAKGYSRENPDVVIQYLRQKAPRYKDELNTIGEGMSGEDVFMAPNLSLDYHREYYEMIGKVLSNKIENREYYIAQMFENIKFDMDEEGARVENEGVITMKETSVEPKPVPHKTMILDKPYWVIMKRYDSVNPYFILGVNNTELMKQED